MGGPFVMKNLNTGSYYIAGIISHGISCDGIVNEFKKSLSIKQIFH